MATTTLTPQTPAKKLAARIGLNAVLYLKREDLHPHGSHKGRSIPLMIKKYRQDGWNNFCISSSGNAAISAALTVSEHNKKNRDKKLRLHIFVGKNIDKNKLKVIEALLDKNVTIKKVTNPKQSAFQIDKKHAAKNLRQSTDDFALVGYEALATELAEIKNLAAVFIPTSSGATAQGLHNGFKKHGLNPQIHIIQTPACHPMVESSAAVKSSLATAIVDKIGYRKEAVQKATRDSGGNGWIVTDEEIAKTKRLVQEKENLDISPNSALAIAGLAQAIKNNRSFNGPIVCILTGR